MRKLVSLESPLLEPLDELAIRQAKAGSVMNGLVCHGPPKYYYSELYGTVLRTTPFRTTMWLMTGGTRSRGARPVAPAVDGLLIVELQRATHATGVRLEELLDDVGVSQGEAHVLALLASGTPQTVGELQRGLGHRPSTLSGILDRLESRKLIRRSLNDADRRSFLITLTRTGHDAAGAVLLALRTVERAALADVTSRDRAGFYAVTRSLLT